MLVTAVMLRTIVEAGEGVLTLVEGIDEPEFLRSRITRHEVRRQLQSMAGALEAIAGEARGSMPEIDWPGWRSAWAGLRCAGPAADGVAWFAARALVPATLMWLQVYRQSEPGMFEFGRP